MPRTDLETFEHLINAAAVDGPRSKAFVPLDLARRLLRKLKADENKPRLVVGRARRPDIRT